MDLTDIGDLVRDAVAVRVLRCKQGQNVFKLLNGGGHFGADSVKPRLVDDLKVLAAVDLRLAEVRHCVQCAVRRVLAEREGVLQLLLIVAIKFNALVVLLPEIVTIVIEQRRNVEEISLLAELIA